MTTLLVGGGHAHIEVVRRRGVRTVGERMVLVNPSRWFTYSGMVPGVVAGHYALSACRIDLAACCEAAGVQFIEGVVTGLDADACVARLADGRALPFRQVSLDVGSTPDLDAIDGARANAVAVRPLGAFVERWSTWHEGHTDAGMVIVGGGAGGVELALAAAHALRGDKRQVTVIGDQLLPEHRPAVRRRIRRHLERCGVRLVDDTATRVDADGVACASGCVVPSSFVVLATGAVAPAWVRQSGVQTDAAGCVVVEPTLRSVSHAHVFAAGDVASLAPEPVPKAGVFAVRQGAVLSRNLAGGDIGGELVAYVPQRRWLSLISVGDRRAVGSYGQWAWEGRWVWRWKDLIDRRWITTPCAAGGPRGRRGALR